MVPQINQNNETKVQSVFKLCAIPPSSPPDPRPVPPQERYNHLENHCYSLILNISTPTVYFNWDLGPRVISEIAIKIRFIFTATGKIKETNMTAPTPNNEDQLPAGSKRLEKPWLRIGLYN